MFINLPDLVIDLIISKLSFNDFYNLKLTCKKLNFIINLKKFKNLFIFVGKYPDNRYLIDNELINYSYSFTTSNLFFFGSIKFLSSFNHIQKLAIFFPFMHDSEENIKYLNCFENLVHLEIDEIENANGRLSLKKLKKFSIIKQGFDGIDFEIDCPELEIFKLKIGIYCNLNVISEMNNLNYLYLNMIDETCLIELIKKCKNLSVLAFHSLLAYYVLKFINENKSIFPSLTEIRIEKINSNELIKETLIELERYSFTMNIKIFINDKIIINFKELNEAYNLIENMQLENEYRFTAISYQKKLLKLSSSNPMFDCYLSALSYLELEDDIELNEKLIYKMRNLRSLKIKYNNGLNNNYIFELMIKIWNQLQTLYLDKLMNLTQNQLNILPNYLLNIEKLSFDKDIKIDDFTFITKFKNLKYIEFCYQINLELIIFIIENCLSMITLSFYIKKIEIIFFRKNKMNSFFYLNKKAYKFSSLDKLINFYNKIYQKMIK